MRTTNGLYVLEVATWYSAQYCHSMVSIANMEVGLVCDGDMRYLSTAARKALAKTSRKLTCNVATSTIIYWSTNLVS